MSKELSDNWRYNLVGDNSWIIDHHLNHNPEDELIEALDGERKEEADDFNMHDYLDKLPERYSSILYEYFIEGCTLKDIGDKRGYTKQYAYQEIRKAKSLIKTEIEKDLGENYVR
jgi:DNA-directed RNA polymerase specialized sigma subunit